MRILYLASDWGLTLSQNGGGGSHIRGTIKGFQENDCDVLAIIGGDFFRNSLNSGDEGDQTGFLFRAQPKGLKKYIPNILRLLLREVRYYLRSRKLEVKAIDVIKKFQPDIIYERSGYYSFLGNRIAKKFKMPLFLETDGCMVEVIKSSYDAFSVSLGNAIEKKKLRRADCVVVYNHYSIPFINTKYSLQQIRKVVKPLGVSIPDTLNNNELTRKSFNIKDTDTVVGFVGTFASYQGVKYLVEAAQLLSNKGLNAVKFLIVGWGSGGETLKKHADQEGLANIIFVGKVDKDIVNKYISLFDIGIVPDADQHIYPIKTLEYGLFGACPLVPDYEVFSEIIVDRENGFVFQRQNSQSIAEIIEWMINSKSAVKNAGLRWKEFVCANFTWENVVRDTVTEMRRVLLNTK